jgi:hypothetical protein
VLANSKIYTYSNVGTYSSQRDNTKAEFKGQPKGRKGTQKKKKKSPNQLERHATQLPLSLSLTPPTSKTSGMVCITEITQNLEIYIDFHSCLYLYIYLVANITGVIFILSSSH